MNHNENNDEKKHDLSPSLGESMEGYFSRLIADNMDIPTQHLEAFTKFMDQQANAYKQMNNRNSTDGKRAAELGFDTVAAYRDHVSQERKYRNRLVMARRMDDHRHAANVYAMEAVWITTNLQSIESVHPEFINKSMLGTHSHQILFDVIYSTCRGFDRSLVGSIMKFFGVVDVLAIQTQIGVEMPDVEEDSDNEDH